MDEIDKLLWEKQKKPLNVLEAKRRHGGEVFVIGKIVTVSAMYVVAVPPKPPETEPEHKDAKFIQLEDIEKLDENELLDVILYDDDIDSVVAGEVVEITGNIELKQKNKKVKALTVTVNATSIKYINRKELVLTDKDIAAIHKFASIDCKEPGCDWSLTKRLTAMFAPNVIGYNNVKVGLLRSAVGGQDKGQDDGGRVNTALIGSPGIAKSTLAREATRIKPNSRTVSAPHASTKSATAIAEKENETISLKLGSIPLARNAICAIEELPEFSLEEQGRLLSVMQEGKFPFEKYGERWEIPSPTTIIATANPVGGNWSHPDVISLDEINVRKTIIDRFHQIYCFRDNMNREQIDYFVNQMALIRKRKRHRYDFLIKYVMYASSILIKAIEPEAESMIGEFWGECKLSGRLGMRMYFGLYTIAEAHAKLHLKDTVDAEIARVAIEAVQQMMVQTGYTARAPTNPKTVAYTRFLEILQNNEAGVAVKALCEIACKENQQIASYLGNNWTMEGNIRLKVIVDMLRNHSQVKEIKSKPLVLQWFGPESDTPDTPDATKSRNVSNKPVEKQKDVISDVSDVSDGPKNGLLKCPHC